MSKRSTRATTRSRIGSAKTSADDRARRHAIVGRYAVARWLARAASLGRGGASATRSRGSRRASGLIRGLRTGSRWSATLAHSGRPPRRAVARSRPNASIHGPFGQGSRAKRIHDRSPRLPEHARADSRAHGDGCRPARPCAPPPAPPTCGTCYAASHRHSRPTWPHVPRDLALSLFFSSHHHHLLGEVGVALVALARHARSAAGFRLPQQCRT